jgi:ribosomal protein S18 acetylase RimI-like enzyme
MTDALGGQALDPGGGLRPATAADLSAVTGLKRAAYARNRELLGVEPLPLQVDYAAVLADPRRETWLAELAGRPVGVLVLKVRDDDLLIESVAVDPEVQGRGWGRLLLAFAIERAGRHDRATVRLYTGTPLAHLVAWYGRHGFRIERIETLPDRSVTHLVRRLA